jgi:hypothetical protein
VKAGNIAPRVGEAYDETFADRIRNDCEHNRHRLRFSMQCRRNGCSERQDYIGLHCYEFIGEFLHQANIVPSPTDFDLQGFVRQSSPIPQAL